jgi:hypothetical protein
VRIFQRNIEGSDNQPPVFMETSTFDNFNFLSLGYLDAPNPDWAIISECGNFPCTGPTQIAVHFNGNTGLTDTSGATADNFTMLGKNGAFLFMKDKECTLLNEWNGIYCKDSSDIAVLMFESLDPDRVDISSVPMYMKTSNGFTSMHNSFMMKKWDGFYPSLERLPRFPGTHQLGYEYDIEFTGPKPKDMRYELLSVPTAAVNKWTIVTVDYQKAANYWVYVGGNNAERMIQASRVRPNEFNKDLGQQGRVSGTAPNQKCGSNRWISIKNQLTFRIDDTYDNNGVQEKCRIWIKHRDAVVGNVRLEWTLTEFFSNGGDSVFADRMASTLDIHPSRIRVVGVMAGSVIVDF